MSELLGRGEYGANAPAEEYNAQFPRYIRITDVSEDGSLREAGKRSLPRKDADRYLLSSGDLLFARSGATVGKTYLHRGDLEACFAGYMIRFKPNPSVILPSYLFAFTKSDRYADWVKSQMRAGAQPNINAEEYGQLSVPFPSLPEQRRIAAVLDTWDDAIATSERLIAAKRERLGWVRDTVLTGCVRLSGFEGDWRRVRLSQVLHEHGATSTGAEPVYSVSVHRGLVDQVEHLGRSFAAASTSNYNRVKPGDIVYTKSPTGDFPLGIIKQSKVDREVIVSPLYGVFKPETRALGIVLDAYFSSAPNALRYLTPLVQKGAKNTIAVTNTQFLQGEVRLPSNSREVDALAALIGATLEDIAVSESEADLLRRQKRGLMQKLLTGEWRVAATSDAVVPGGLAADRLEAAE